MYKNKSPQDAVWSGRLGFSLIEVTLAIAVGLIVLSASFYAFRQVNEATKWAKYKSMVGTIQTNIQMDKFRMGVPPPHTATPRPNAPTPDVVPFGLYYNRDYTNKPYWPDVVATGMPPDPVFNKTDVYSFDSSEAMEPLAAGAPSAQWDNPAFANPSPTVYGNGGWLYDPQTGAFRANVSNQQYPEQRPAGW